MAELKIIQTLLVQTIDFRSHFRVRRCEWFFALATLVAGATLLLWSDIPALFPVGLAQEPWGWIVLAIGALRTSMLWVNGRWHVSPFFRSAGALACFTIFVMAGLAQSTDTHPTQMRILWFLFAVFDAINAWDAAGDAGAAMHSRAREKTAQRA